MASKLVSLLAMTSSQIFSISLFIVFIVLSVGVWWIMSFMLTGVNHLGALCSEMLNTQGCRPWRLSWLRNYLSLQSRLDLTAAPSGGRGQDMSYSERAYGSLCLTLHLLHIFAIIILFFFSFSSSLLCTSVFSWLV